MIFAASLCAASAAKAPFKVLYNNDTTNLESCVAPFHPQSGAPFEPQVLKASIDEAIDAGADAYLLSMGLLYVPLWDSKIYPPKEHFEWFYKNFPRTPRTGFATYMMQGGDYLQLYLDHCKDKKVAAFVSLRMNDYHAVEDLDAAPGARLHVHSALAIDRFRREYPQWRLGNFSGGQIDPKNTFAVRESQVMDWAHPQVRARVLGFIAEVCAYEIDGLELDFLRHFRLFNPNTTTLEQRREIVTAFMKEVRSLLDKSQKDGKRRHLSVRVPAVKAAQDALGLDLAALERAGVDMINLSANYYTVQDGMELARNRAEAPNAAMYLEMTHVTVVGADPGRKTGDSNFYRRTTDEQFYTTAHIAYANRLDGVSLFNFAYYREYGHKPERGPFSEPPFHVIQKIADKNAVANSPQFYFLSPVWRSPYGNSVQLPKTLRAKQPVALTFQLYPPKEGFKSSARLRIQSAQPITPGSVITARFNGENLTPIANIAEPFKTPYPHLLGTEETLRAWEIPHSLLKEGENKISLELKEGGAIRIMFVDLSIK